MNPLDPATRLYFDAVFSTIYKHMLVTVLAMTFFAEPDHRSSVLYHMRLEAGTFRVSKSLLLAGAIRNSATVTRLRIILDRNSEEARFISKPQPAVKTIISQPNLKLRAWIRECAGASLGGPDVLIF